MRARPHVLALVFLGLAGLAVPGLAAAGSTSQVGATPAGTASVAAEAARSERLQLAMQADVRSSRSSPASRPEVIWPVPPIITSEFGSRWGRHHTGIDFDAATGEPIKAVRDGDVAFAGWKNGYGIVVVLDHGGGLTTMYAHQSELGVAAGQRVGQGDVVGKVGSTGRSTGAHLHFETRIDDVPQDPRPWLPQG